MIKEISVGQPNCEGVTSVTQSVICPSWIVNHIVMSCLALDITVSVSVTDFSVSGGAPGRSRSMAVQFPKETKELRYQTLILTFSPDFFWRVASNKFYLSCGTYYKRNTLKCSNVDIHFTL